MINFSIKFPFSLLCSGDAECLSGICTNGKCQIVDGKVSCVCKTGYVKNLKDLCVKTGKRMVNNGESLVKKYRRLREDSQFDRDYD